MKIMQILRKLKKTVNSADADRAREHYPTSAEFAKHFFYRKGNKMMPLKTDAHIARKFRKMKGSPTITIILLVNPSLTIFISLIWGCWGCQMAEDAWHPQMAVSEPPWLLVNPTGPN